MVMKKTVLSLCIVGVALIGVVSQSQAGGSGGVAPCQVNTSSSLGPNLIGHAAITVSASAGGAGVVDATLRLRWGSKEDVFRAYLPSASLSTPEEVLCQVLKAYPTCPTCNDGQGPLNSAGVSILTAFGINASTIKINNKSLTGVSFDQVPGSGGALGGAHSSGLGEVTMYPQ